MAVERHGFRMMCFQGTAETGEEVGHSAEGSANAVTSQYAERPPPSDRTVRQQLLEKCFRDAHEKAALLTAEPMCHGRVALFGLIVLAMIRAMAWWEGNIPGYSVFGMHFLTTTADVACILCSLPLFISGTTGQCVQVGCVGPMLTLVFAMSIVDLGALCAYLAVATPRPLAPAAKSFVDVLEACIGVWEFALLASVSLQLVLCASSWRIYRELRMTGLYPPGSNPAGIGKIEEVSFLELICEAEDVKMVNECECAMGGAPKGDSRPRDAGVAPK